MNARKLDINAPLMSVRRSSGASPSRKVLEKRGSLAYYLDQVTEPVAVPFNWEHIPGRPKGVHGSQPQPSKDSPRKKDDEKIRSNNAQEDDDEDDDVYSDALDTLSCTESASMKCSASGVSGLDDFDADKHGTNAAADKQAQDFMMNRFLPAAKAMTVQPPQYASSRKQQSVLAEQPRDIQRLVREERKSIVNKHITDIVPYTGQFQDEEESDDDDDGYDDSTDVSAKGCGMFTRLRVRSSLCLLNTVPGMKMKDEYNMSGAYEYGKPSKSSHTPIKKAWESIQKNELSRKWRSESERFTYKGESETKQLGGSGRISSFRRSRTSFQSKPQPIFPKRSSNSASLAIEKTLFIENASATTSSSSVSCSVDTTTQRTEDTITMFDAKTLLLASKENNQEQEDKAQENNQESMSLQLVQSSFEKETKIDNNNNNNKQIVAVDQSFGGELVVSADLIPAPLLPKSPSDSWLRRALPLVYMKNSGFPQSKGENKLVAKRQSWNASSRFVKWETKVKTWNMHDGHANSCQELTVYKPQHSKY
ncbi:hypothetical protein PIB30_082049 [Stylosanthes scabra]|uniref:Uncharacterized protein n=1 Tax=Stylosanthes scabra TaxID=79078 RepID=A0ABU6TUQ5_9FABA|nr:hypothetical protein [Stylosanthes scabra]